MSRTSRSARLRSRLAVGLFTSLLAASLTTTAVSAQSASPPVIGGPDTPVSSGPNASGGPGIGRDGATLAVPQDGLSDLRLQGWDHIDVAPDGRTLTVYFWNGVDTCYGLAAVDVTTVDGVVSVALQVGTLPNVDACIEIAQSYKTIVVLDSPLVLGGIGD